MPTRMLRNWTSSEKVDKLSIGAEVFFTRLIMTVDDFGRFHANPKLLKSALFPLREISHAEVEDWLMECADELLVLYSVDGKAFLQIREFNQRLRLKTSKFPEPSDTCPSHARQVSDKRPPETEVEVEVEVEVEARNGSEKRETELVFGPLKGPEVSESYFLPSEIVAFVNDTFGKEFNERNLTRFDRDLINDLITARNYTKEQILTAWSNIQYDDFQRSKSFNIVTFRYLSEPKTIERYLFWKIENNGKSTTGTGKPTAADKRASALERLAGRRDPKDGAVTSDQETGFDDVTIITDSDQ